MEKIKTFEELKKYVKSRVLYAIEQERDNKSLWKRSRWVCDDNVRYFLRKDDKDKVAVEIVELLLKNRNCYDYAADSADETSEKLLEIMLADFCFDLMEAVGWGFIEDLHQKFWDFENKEEEIDGIEREIDGLDEEDEDYEDDLERLEEELQEAKDEYEELDSELTDLLDDLDERYEVIKWEDIV